MARTRIKICGLTRPDDAAQAAALGADAVGLVFYPPSKRAVDFATAVEIVAELPPFVTATALFLDPDRAQVEEVLARIPIGLLQFHGSESADFCASFARPWIKAQGMAGGGDPAAFAADYAGARAILVDGHPPGAPGGSGMRLDWDRLPVERNYRLVLAGGLTPANVATAVSRVRPDAVDVSSGVERAKGYKDALLMRKFIEEVRRGDRVAESESE
jgi:phosphoribosylanthranilate isomerase